MEGSIRSVYQSDDNEHFILWNGGGEITLTFHAAFLHVLVLLLLLLLLLLLFLHFLLLLLFVLLLLFLLFRMISSTSWFAYVYIGLTGRGHRGRGRRGMQINKRQDDISLTASSTSTGGPPTLAKTCAWTDAPYAL